AAGRRGELPAVVDGAVVARPAVARSRHLDLGAARHRAGAAHEATWRGGPIHRRAQSRPRCARRSCQLRPREPLAPPGRRRPRPDHKPLMSDKHTYPFTVKTRDGWAIPLPASLAFITEPLVGFTDITVIGRLGDAALL